MGIFGYIKLHSFLLKKSADCFPKKALSDHLHIVAFLLSTIICFLIASVSIAYLCHSISTENYRASLYIYLIYLASSLFLHVAGVDPLHWTLCIHHSVLFPCILVASYTHPKLLAQGFLAEIPMLCINPVILLKRIHLSDQYPVTFITLGLLGTTCYAICRIINFSLLFYQFYQQHEYMAMVAFSPIFYLNGKWFSMMLTRSWAQIGLYTFKAP